MDKDWLTFSRPSTEYREGAQKFVQVAKEYGGNRDKIICPCIICQNQCFQLPAIVYEHLVMNEIDPSYTTWEFHGEQEPILQQHDHANMTETYHMYRDVLAEDDGTGKANLLIGDENFKQKVEEAEAPLYEGCTKYTKLTATVVLYKIKASNGATDKLFDELIQALKDMFSEDLEQLETCPKCGSSRWQGFAFGPITQVMSYSRYVVNGRRFCTRASEKTAQDSGVYLEAETSVNGTEEIKKVLCYGVIQEILVMDYYTFQVPIFKCDWANTSNGIKVDDGFTLVNLHRLNQFQKDPFILASQAKQVFYSRESETSDWYVVLKAPPKGFHDLGKFAEDAYMSYAPLDVYKLDDCVGDEDEGYVRADCEAIPVYN
ncbi:hypothetical protein ACFX10_037625 [Malus domestica]